MAIYKETNIKPHLAIILLGVSFFFLFSFRQVGDRELYWNEGTHAAVAQEISFQQPVCTSHGVASLEDYPLFHLLAGGLRKCGVPVVLSLRLLSLTSLFCLVILVGVAAYRQHGPLAGVVSSAVMISTNVILEKSLEGYPNTMMMLFLMIGWLLWFYFGAGGGGWSRAWIFAFIFCGLAFYTGGFKAVVLFLVPLIFMRRPLTIWSKLRRRGFAIGLLIFAGFILLWGVPLMMSGFVVRPLDLELNLVKYLKHLLFFPFDVAFRLLPWSIFIWAPFCVGLHHIDPHPIFSRFLRTIYFVLFFIIWLSPFSTPRDIMLLVPPAAILSGIYYWIIIRRYGGHIFNLLYPLNWGAIVCGALLIGFYLLPSDWWSPLFSLSRGIGFRGNPQYFWPGMIRGGIMCVAGGVLIFCRRGQLPLWLHINFLACLGMMFFWSTIHPYKAQNSVQRELGAQVEKSLIDQPDSELVYKYNITGLFGAMLYADKGVQKIYSLENLPKKRKFVYLICTEFPEYPSRKWTELFIDRDHFKKKIILYKGELKSDSSNR